MCPRVVQYATRTTAHGGPGRCNATEQPLGRWGVRGQGTSQEKQIILIHKGKNNKAKNHQSRMFTNPPCLFGRRNFNKMRGRIIYRTESQKEKSSCSDKANRGNVKRQKAPVWKGGDSPKVYKTSSGLRLAKDCFKKRPFIPIKTPSEHSRDPSAEKIGTI